MMIVIDAAGGYRRDRRIVGHCAGVHEHVHDIEPVGAEIGEFAAAEIEECAEIQVLRRIPIAVFQRAEEAHPIEIVGFARRLGGQRLVRAAVPHAIHVGDFPDQPRTHEPFAGFEINLSGALLHPHLADAIVHSRRTDDFGAFFALAGERLLDVDVFSRVERVDRDGFMPVIRRGNQDGVDARHFEELAMIAECPGTRRLRHALSARSP